MYSVFKSVASHYLSNLYTHPPSHYNKCLFVYSVFKSAASHYLSNLYTHPPPHYNKCLFVYSVFKSAASHCLSNLYTHHPSHYHIPQELVWPPEKGHRSWGSLSDHSVEMRMRLTWDDCMQVWDCWIGQGHRPCLLPSWIIPVFTRSTLTAALNCPGVNQVNAYCHPELSRC